MIVRALVVAVLGAVFGGFAVPAGFLLGLAPLVTFVSATLGALGLIWLVLLGGGAARDRLVERLGGTAEGRSGRARHLVDRYGVRGLGLIGPLFPGVATSCVVGLSLGLDASALARWMSIGTAGLYAVYTLFWWIVGLAV